MEVSSTDAGMLMPRLTQAQRLAIPSPPDGLVVFQTGGTEDFYYARNGTWYRLNEVQPFRNEITMGATPIISPGGTFSSLGFTASNVSTGVMQVNTQNYGSVPVKLITPYFNEIPSPPSIPDDLCKPSFTNNCGQSGTLPTYQHAIVVGITSPPTLGGPPAAGQFRLCWRDPNGNNCNNDPNGDYYYLGSGSTDPYFNPASQRCGFVTNAYNNNAGIQPGEQYELFLRGNTQTSISTRFTALSVFIDWNQDADFFDPDEIVFTSSKQVWPTSYGGTGSLTPAFTVPAQAVTGDCTMRVIASKIDNNVQPCLTTADGSSKDFSFFIANGAAPVYPAENRYCNLSDETPSSFRVRCYDNEGTPVNTKVHILINPF
jgi:hypothetical protein